MKPLSTGTPALAKKPRKNNPADKPNVATSQAPARGPKDAKWRQRDLRARPGFLIRRLYQIHVALFAEECAAEQITPVQYSLLTALDQLGTVDQATLSRVVALDRTNVADVIARLERRKLLKRRGSPTDRRMMLSFLTDEGRSLIDRIETAAERASDRTIAALPAQERELFLDALKRLIASNEVQTQRSPALNIRRLT